MKSKNRCIRFTNLAMLAIATAGFNGQIARAGGMTPATGPTTQPMAGTVDALTADVEKQFALVQDVLSSPDILMDSSKRAAAAPQVIPSLKKLVADFDGLTKADPDNKQEAADRRSEFNMFLSLFGDTDATQALAKQATSTDPEQATDGKRNQLMVTWLASAKDTSVQTGVVDEIEKLAKADPASTGLTIQMYQMSQMGSSSPDLSKRLAALVTDVMKNSVADGAKAQMAAEQKLLVLENKPLVIAGKQPDGKPFTTADWKGKVVLIDFWATWCGPCLGELPHVAKIYTDYHTKGLEVVGVSNDSSPEVLNKFVGENKTVVWPQILDQAGQGNSSFGPITLAQGIEGIPTMFLIDKKGILRSVTARENMDTLIPQLLDEK